jgi:hypothetical protein
MTMTRERSRALLHRTRTDCSALGITMLLCGADFASEPSPVRKGCSRTDWIGGVCGEGIGRPVKTGANSANRRLYHLRQWR